MIFPTQMSLSPNRRVLSLSPLPLSASPSTSLSIRLCLSLHIPWLPHFSLNLSVPFCLSHTLVSQSEELVGHSSLCHHRFIVLEQSVTEQESCAPSNVSNVSFSRVAPNNVRRRVSCPDLLQQRHILSVDCAAVSTPPSCGDLVPSEGGALKFRVRNPFSATHEDEALGWSPG